MTDVRRVLARLGIEGRVFGDHLLALCPFHEDQTPSWRIRLRGDRKGLHHCFACKEGGDLYDLVMHVREYGTRAAAVGWVEEHFGSATKEDLTLPAIQLVSGLAHQRRKFRMPAGFEEQALEEWPTIPREYLAERGVTADQALRWGIGYALDGRLHGRIVIPIHNVWGELCSYVGRAFLDMPKRYLYPDEKEGADVDVMFGERHWPAPVPQRGLVVLLEGALKALAVERAFPQIAVAALGGSDVRLLHLTKLSTFRRVLVFTDADAPGEEAGDELVASLSGMTKTARVRLPIGEDADSVPIQKVRDLLWPHVSR